MDSARTEDGHLTSSCIDQMYNETKVYEGDWYINVDVKHDESHDENH